LEVLGGIGEEKFTGIINQYVDTTILFGHVVKCGLNGIIVIDVYLNGLDDAGSGGELFLSVDGCSVGLV